MVEKNNENSNANGQFEKVQKHLASWNSVQDGWGGELNEEGWELP